MWVDNDVLNWLLTLKNLHRSPFSKWPPQYRKNSTRYQESNQDIKIYLNMKFHWNQPMLNFCVLWRPFWKWRPVEIVQCRESRLHYR
jgi:hypothetical protein